MALQMFACTATQTCVIWRSHGTSVAVQTSRLMDHKTWYSFVVLGPFVCHSRFPLWLVFDAFFFSFFFFFLFHPDGERTRNDRIILVPKFDRSARDQRPVSADLVFIIINLFFIFGKLGPSRDSSRESYSSAAGIQCLETPTRVMLLSGYPQATRHP